MSLFINTNLSSLTAQNNLSGSQALESQAITQLSSGLKINSAADDPAGQATATLLQSLINGQTIAQSNANVGISLAQTGESALTQITNNLQTARQLAVQASNGTNTAANRASLNQEYQQALNQINSIASTTNFNGLNLLTGTFGTSNFQVGANAGNLLGINLSQGVQTSQIGQTYTATNSLAGTTGLSAGGLSVSLGGAAAIAINAATAGTGAGQGADSAFAAAAAVNAQNIAGLTATATNSQQFSLSNVSNSSTTTAETYNLTINGVNIFGSSGTTIAASGTLNSGNIVSSINAQTANSGVTATLNTDGSVQLSTADGSNITVTQTGGAQVTGGLDNTAYTIGNGTAGTLSSTAYSGSSSTTGELQGSLQLSSAQSISLTGTAATAIQAQNTANTSSNLTSGGQTLTGGTFATPGTSLSGGQLTVNGVDVLASSGSNLTVSQVASAINNTSALQAAGVSASVSGSKLVITDTKGAVTVGGTKANTILGQTVGSNVLSYAGAGITDANVNTDTGGTLTAGQFVINGTSITGINVTTGAALVNLINNNAAIQADGITAAFTSGTSFTLTNANGGPVTLTGAVATALKGQATTTTETLTGAAADGALANAAGSFTTPLTITAGQLSINGTNVAAGTYTTVASFNTAVQTASGNVNLTSAVTAGGTFSLTTSDGSSFTVGGSAINTFLGNTVSSAVNNSFAVSQSTTGLSGTDVLTASDAQKAIQSIDSALSTVNTLQGQLGAVQNRFSSTISNLTASTQNAQSAQSTIQDADFASASAQLSRAQVLQQAGVSVLATANQQGQLALKLLG